MKTILLLSCFLFINYLPSTAQQESRIESELKSILSKQVELDEKLQHLSVSLKNNRSSIRDLEQHNAALYISLDSLRGVCDSLKKIQVADRTAINDRIQDTNNMVSLNQSTVEKRTFWGGIITIAILFILLTISYYLIKRIKTGTSSIDEVRKAQEALLSAQTKMQEESIKLDNQLLAIVQRQIDAISHTVNNTHSEPDHSLVVKLADEIARIETNLSKMDKSVKGYKQLVQAKDRMINNVRANGYEIISLLGQEYNDGMQFPTRFVPDESLPEGKRIITGMIKMQVNYNGKMIQPAEIVVSQNI